MENIIGWEDDRDPSLLTNFEVSRLWVFERAIEVYGDDTIYIDSGAFDNRGRRLPGHMALRTKLLYKDRSDFWKVFASLQLR